LSEEVMLRYGDIVRRNPDQETNDQTKAIQYLSSKGIRRVVVLGATGMREDHTLGNISLLPEYLREGLEVRAYTDYGVFIPVNGDASFRCRPGTQVSVFNFGSEGMHSEGLKYPLRHFDALWQGTLNEAVTGEFTIYARGEYMVFINY
ncbi:MAG: thiamine diphosphokinase, partial [Muribaculaceae bacterium]|nr:thiamine diphosphokinase [Muribaculaceae bacterium]